MVEAGFRPAATIVGALLLGSIIGCTGRTPADLEPVPIPSPLTQQEVRSLAAILEAEDRREFRMELFRASGAAAEPGVRAQAALAAGRIGAPGARPLVRALLQDEDTAVAATAAFAAGQLRDTAAIALLAHLLDEGSTGAHPTVAAEAAAALGKIATAEARESLVEFLAAAPPEDPSNAPVVRHALLGAFLAGEDGVTPYARWLSHRDAEVRRAAAYGLSRRPRSEALPLLIPAFLDPDPLVRSYAVRSAASTQAIESGIPAEELLPAIVRAANDSMYHVRIEAIRTLSTYSGARSVAHLLSVLETGGSHETVAAIDGLGSMGASARDAFPGIQHIAEDPGNPAFIRGAAIEALARIDPARAAMLLGGYAEIDEWRVRAAVARALADIGSGAAPQLERLVRDADARVAAAALRQYVALLRVGAIGSATRLLIEALGATDLYVRAAALEGLAFLADPVTLPALLDAYDAARDDPQNDAALAAIDALATVGSETAVAPERAFFARFPRSADYHVRRRAVERFGAAALRSWGDPGAIPPLTTSGGYHDLIELWRAPASPDRDLPRVRIETEIGAIELLLYGDDAPITTANFLGLAQVGFFDGQEWPRVVPNFVVQGGDPRGDTSGGPGYTIRDELNRRRFDTGTLGMAHSGPDSGGSQFFITHAPQPHLDGGYTVFGEVLSGQAVLQELLPGHRIVSVRQISGREL